MDRRVIFPNIRIASLTSEITAAAGCQKTKMKIVLSRLVVTGCTIRPKVIVRRKKKS
jgi:hypothetical protein